MRSGAATAHSSPCHTGPRAANIDGFGSFGIGAAGCAGRVEVTLGMWKSIVAVGIGAALGALLRWWLGNRLNALFPSLPPGTLAANILGAYVIGCAIAFFARFPALPPQWQLLIITGFCGGLTTFSTFSAEVVMKLRDGRTDWALAEIAVHVIASLAMTFAGIATVTWLAG